MSALKNAVRMCQYVMLPDNYLTANEGSLISLRGERNFYDSFSLGDLTPEKTFQEKKKHLNESARQVTLYLL